MEIVLMGLYKPPSLSKKDFLFHLNNAYNFFWFTYENIKLIGDFSMKPVNEKLNVLWTNLNIWS